MALQFDKIAFQKAFATVSKASNGRIKEILGNVRVKADGTRATLCGTDSELYVEVSIDCDGSGDVLLPASRTLAILTESGDENLTIEPTKNGIRLECGKASFDLASFDPAEFPAAPKPPSDSSLQLSLNSQGLRHGLKCTDYAVDRASTRYQLGGVGLDIGAGIVTCVATDGRRLAAYELATIGDHPVSGTIPILPAKACKIIESAIGESSEIVKLVIGLNIMRLEFEGVSITTSLIEGRYPNWRMVEGSIADSVPVSLVAKVFLGGVRQASIVSDVESRAVNFNIRDGELQLSAKTVDVGASVVTMPVSYVGEPISITLDGRFVMDFCKVLDPLATVEMLVSSPERPVLLRSGESLRYTLMPMAKN